ncbi:MAG: hypothetical protein K6C34_04545 [Alphaproteobacteria bacterium]|nr:hypothetical protein [Alphaproteobacteria bacterium]
MSKIKKLFYSALIAFIGIGVNPDIEARVTKEVAEATLPYLMEAAGIPGDVPSSTTKRANLSEYEDTKIQAILNMIYTDEGQQQMVNWARNGEFPPILARMGFVTENLYLHGWLSIPLQQHTAPPIRDADIQNLMVHIADYPMLSYAVQAMRDAYIGSLFPCGPGTFSSYAAHPSRLGFHALDNGGGNLENICAALISNTFPIPDIRDVQNIITRLRPYNGTVDNQLSRIIFVLDICETVVQVKNILTQVLPPSDDRNTDIDTAIRRAVPYNEYAHRPVSATTFPRIRQGDCVETLYRHLINIAIQNDATAPKNFNVGHLLDAFKEHYYGPIYIQNYTKPDQRNPHPQNLVFSNITTINGESGLTQLRYHGYWRDALSAVQGIGNFSNATITNIVRVLRNVSPTRTSALGVRAATGYLNPGLVPIIQNTPTQQANATDIQNALNALDGRCPVGNERFIVQVTDDREVITTQVNFPNEIDVLIEIADKLWNRTIKVGIWTNRHAEIVNIQ